MDGANEHLRQSRKIAQSLSCARDDALLQLCRGLFREGEGDDVTGRKRVRPTRCEQVNNPPGHDLRLTRAQAIS